MFTYSIFNHNTNKLEFFETLDKLMDYLGINKFIANSEELLELGYFLLKVTIQSLDRPDIKSNPYDNTLIIVEHEYLVLLPLFLIRPQYFKATKSTLSIWNCIIQQYSELLNNYSENVLGITPFDINYSIHHSTLRVQRDVLQYNRVINTLKSILTTYKQEYLTDDL